MQFRVLLLSKNFHLHDLFSSAKDMVLKVTKAYTNRTESGQNGPKQTNCTKTIKWTKTDQNRSKASKRDKKRSKEIKSESNKLTFRVLL